MNIAKRCFVTAFFAGYCPVAPGTCGTGVAFLIALCAWLILPVRIAMILNIILFAVLLLPAFRLSSEAEEYFGEKDPQKVVIDEVLGYFLAIMFHEVTIPLLLAAFVLFRVYDILKPFPVNQVQEVKGGAGVVLDDLVAGLYANATLTLMIFAQSFFGISML